MNRILIFALCFIMLLSYTSGDENKYNIPGNNFNSYVIQILESYPTDGTHQYYWPSTGSWAGNVNDLYYLGTLFSKGDSLKRCYCCGITFEVFFRAYKKYCEDKQWNFVIKDFTCADLYRFRRQWFGADGNRKTLQNAIVVNKLGKAITLLKARKGDFVQFWRYSGSGHSVIFIKWIKNYSREIIGMKYWSTQSSTQGIGYNTEYLEGTRGIDPDQIYIARITNK